MAVGFRAQALWFAGVAWLAVLAGSALAGSVLGGCGGQVEAEDGPTAAEGSEESDGSETEDEGSGGSTSEGSTSVGSTSEGSTAEPGPGDLQLGECELGLAPEDEAGPCNWLASDRCYDTKPAACACICPTDGPSVCSSDFYGGEDSETRVSCR